VKLSGREIIVLNGITGPDDVGTFEAGDGPDEVSLNIKGQTSRDAVDIYFTGMSSFGLEENGVRRFLGKAHNFVFDGGAISGTGSFNLMLI
jgi:hypothetical protein